MVAASARAVVWAPDQATTNGSRAAALEVASNEFAAIWSDRAFKRYFVGTYGISTEVEPKVTPPEQEILQAVLPLMGKSNAVAARVIEKQAKAGKSAILDFTLGNIYLQMDQLDRAAARFKTATARFPNFLRAWRSSGLLAMRVANYPEALQAFARVIELGGADGYIFGLMGVAYTAREDFLAAETSFRNAMALQPENTDWRLGLTRSIFKQQKFDEAATLLDTLIERSPDKAEYWALQANAYLAGKKPLKAAENLETALRLGKGTPDSIHTLGDIYLQEGLLGLAASSYGRALEADPAQKPARAMRDAELLLARGAQAEALALTAAIRSTCGTNLVPEDARALLKLDARIALSRGASDEASKVLEDVLKSDPLDGDALLLLAQHHAAKNENEQAFVLLERAAGIEKFEFDAVFRHARLLVKAGRYADALPLLKRALELRPREDVARFKEQVERAAKTR